MWYVIIFAATLLLDQVSKILTDGTPEVVFINGIINFKSVYNTGASFSLFADKLWAQDFFLILTVVVLLGGGVYVIFSKKKSKWLWVAVALLFSGAIGNFIDRLAFKYVRDFISFAFFDFPTFNVADSCLCIGVAMLVIYLLFLDEDGLFSDNSASENADKNSDKSVKIGEGGATMGGENAVLNTDEGDNKGGLKAKSIKINANGANDETSEKIEKNGGEIKDE